MDWQKHVSLLISIDVHISISFLIVVQSFVILFNHLHSGKLATTYYSKLPFLDVGTSDHKCFFTDHYEEALRPLHRQLLDTRHVLLGSGFGLLSDLRLRRRETQLQGHRAAGCHCDATYSE